MIIPITQARSQLSALTDQLGGDTRIILTKGGRPKAVLVDPNYLDKIEKAISALYQQTYINQELLPLTREFSDQEIEQWAKADQL